MIFVLSIVLAIVFLSISLLHFNWAFRGIDNVAKVFPVIPGKKGPSQPSPFLTGLVAIALLAIALFYFWKAQIFEMELSPIISKYLGWLVSIIFLIRAIGDFKYVGFFSKIRSTEFSKLDRKYYSPLCLLIAILGILIQTLA